MSCPQLVMHEGFYCGMAGEFYIPKAHSLREYCYDGSHLSRCRCYSGTDAGSRSRRAGFLTVA